MGAVKQTRSLTSSTPEQHAAPISPPCSHSWAMLPAHAATSIAVCKKCLEQTTFKNSLEYESGYAMMRPMVVSENWERRRER